MKKTQILTSAIASAMFFLLLASCLPKKKVTASQLTNVATDAALTQSLNDDLYNVVDGETKNGQYKDSVNGKTDFTYQSLIDTCALVTFNNNGGLWPKTLTIDFGTGCTNLSTGVIRRGKLNISISGKLDEAGKSATVIPDNYFVNGNKIEGTKVISNSGRNMAGNIVYRVQDMGVRITKTDGGVITWESDRNHEFIAGEATNFFTHGISGICDDTYALTGWAQGEVSSGDDYRMEIAAPLQHTVCCRYVQSGSITYFLNGDEVATVSYGDGTCDASADLDFDGRVYVVIIP